VSFGPFSAGADAGYQASPLVMHLAHACMEQINEALGLSTKTLRVNRVTIFVYSVVSRPSATAVSRLASAPSAIG
jgi:hypothetical protein